MRLDTNMMPFGKLVIVIFYAALGVVDAVGVKRRLAESQEAAPDPGEAPAPGGAGPRGGVKRRVAEGTITDDPSSNSSPKASDPLLDTLKSKGGRRRYVCN